MSRKPKYDKAPEWVEGTRPRRTNPVSILLLQERAGEGWAIATREQCDDIDNNESFMGEVLRKDAAVLTLAYVMLN